MTHPHLTYGPIPIFPARIPLPLPPRLKRFDSAGFRRAGIEDHHRSASATFLFLADCRCVWVSRSSNRRLQGLSAWQFCSLSPRTRQHRSAYQPPLLPLRHPPWTSLPDLPLPRLTRAQKASFLLHHQRPSVTTSRASACLLLIHPSSGTRALCHCDKPIATTRQYEPGLTPPPRPGRSTPTIDLPRPLSPCSPTDTTDSLAPRASRSRNYPTLILSSLPYELPVWFLGVASGEC